MDTSQIEREKCQNLQLELEQVKQELHQSNIRLKVLEATYQDLKQDIILTKAETGHKQQELETKTKTEEVLANLRASQTEEIIQLECQLSAKIKEFERLQNEIQFYKKKVLIEDEVTLDDNVKPEIILLENETLIQKCQELHLRVENIQQQRHSLFSSIQESQENLAEHQAALEIKNEELAEKTNVIEELKHDLENSKKELETLKNQPLPTNSQGNSMFTEIEDRRVQLEEIGTEMSSKYTHLQKECQQNKLQILKLHTERAELLDKIENIFSDTELNNGSEEEYLINEIETRKASVLASRAKLNELPKLITTVPKRDQTKHEFLYYQEVLDSKNEEVSKQETDLINQSTHVCDLAKTLSEAQKKQKILELNQMKLQHLIDEVKECEMLNKELEICRKSVYMFSIS